MKHKLVLALVTVMLLASGLMAIVAQAEVAAPIDFESPTYTIGSIHNQDGWSSSGSAGVGSPGFDHAVAAQSLYPTFGGQSLRISNAVTSGSFGNQTFSNSLVDEAGELEATNNGMSGGARQAHFEAQWDFASATGTYQAGLFVSASPDRGDGGRMSYVGMSDTAGGLQVDFYDVQYLGPGPANFVMTTVASNLDRTVPHTIHIAMDFVDGPSNDVVTVTVDGTYTHTGTSWEDYFRYDPESAAEQNTRTVDSILFLTRNPAVPGTSGNGFFIDNLALQSGVYTLESLSDMTADLVENRNVERKLLASLDRAERFMDSRPQIARMALYQYIIQVQLYEFFGLISPEAADQLTAQTQQIISSLQ